jgi:hypothetical protein
MAHSPVVKRLNAALHAVYDAVTNEPVPERWVDLIKRLSQEERARREASQEQTKSPQQHRGSE